MNSAARITLKVHLSCGKNYRLYLTNRVWLLVQQGMIALPVPHGHGDIVNILKEEEKQANCAHDYLELRTLKESGKENNSLGNSKNGLSHTPVTQKNTLRGVTTWR